MKFSTYQFKWAFVTFFCLLTLLGVLSVWLEPVPDKEKLLRLFWIIPLLSLLFAVFVAMLSTKWRFRIVNMAKEPITNASVIIFDQTIEMKDIQPNKRASGFYKVGGDDHVKGDEHYTIVVEFQSGKKLQKKLQKELQKKDEYVLSGNNLLHEITVTDTDMDITRIWPA